MSRRRPRNNVCEECGVDLNTHQHLETCTKHPANQQTVAIPIQTGFAQEQEQALQMVGSEHLVMSKPLWYSYLFAYEFMYLFTDMILALFLLISKPLWLLAIFTGLLLLFIRSYLWRAFSPMSFGRFFGFLTTWLAVVAILVGLLTFVTPFWWFDLVAVLYILVQLGIGFYRSRVIELRLTEKDIIVIHNPFFVNENKETIPLKSIRNHNIDQNFVEKLFNVGRLTLVLIGEQSDKAIVFNALRLIRELDEEIGRRIGR